MLSSNIIHVEKKECDDAVKTISTCQANFCRLAENKRPTGLNGHLSIRDYTLTSCQKDSCLYINSPIKK